MPETRMRGGGGAPANRFLLLQTEDADDAADGNEAHVKDEIENSGARRKLGQVHISKKKGEKCRIMLVLSR